MTRGAHLAPGITHSFEHQTSRHRSRSSVKIHTVHTERFLKLCWMKHSLLDTEKKNLTIKTTRKFGQFWYDPDREWKVDNSYLAHFFLFLTKQKSLLSHSHQFIVKLSNSEWVLLPDENLVRTYDYAYEGLHHAVKPLSKVIFWETTPFAIWNRHIIHLPNW